MIVTDKKYYLPQYLVENLIKIPIHLKDAWDCVFIVSGHGKIRIGKSTLAGNSGYFIAWLLAGGELEPYEEKGENDKVLKKYRVKKEPKTLPTWGLENFVFSPQELMDAAAKLPRNSVIIYDEGRAGLESKRAMANVNKAMEDFFQECGQYGHVLIIVLPNFFKLAEDYAVDRSLFLLDVFAVPKGNRYVRGYFRFYNEAKKELLYQFGKRKYSVESKYSSVSPNFWGKFTNYFTIPRDVYDAKKRQALVDKALNKSGAAKSEVDGESNLNYKETRRKHQFENTRRLERAIWTRNGAIFTLQQQGFTLSEVANHLNKFADEKVTPKTIEDWILDFKKEKVRRIEEREQFKIEKDKESLEEAPIL